MAQLRIRPAWTKALPDLSRPSEALRRDRRGQRHGARRWWLSVALVPALLALDGSPVRAQDAVNIVGRWTASFETISAGGYKTGTYGLTVTQQQGRTFVGTIEGKADGGSPTPIFGALGFASDTIIFVESGRTGNAVGRMIDETRFEACTTQGGDTASVTCAAYRKTP